MSARLGSAESVVLPVARETEEERDVAVGALVGGRVERELVVLDGHEVVHDREDALLHLTGVLGAEDDHLVALEVDLDRGGGGHAGGEAVGGELAGVVDDEVGLAKVLELLLGRADEHVVHEERVVGTAANDADLDAVLGVPAGEAVKDVDVVARVEVVDGTLAVDLKRVLVHLDVDGAPPDVVLGGLLVDDALVLGRTAGLLARVVDERTGGRDDGALLLDGVLVQLGYGGVALEVDLVHVEAGIGEELEIRAEQRVVRVVSGQLIVVVSWRSHVGRESGKAGLAMAMAMESV